MKEKVCLVSGANSGIGFEMAKGLALQGAQVLLLCRNLQKAEAAKQKIVEAGAGLTPLIFIADFSNLVTVRKAAREVMERFDHLDVLINNAGCIFMKRTLTQDGHEANFQVNYLAHFLLTRLLLPHLKKAEQGRIVTVVGEFHRRYPMNWDDLQYEKKYGPLKPGSQAQLAKMLFANDLARSLSGTSLTSNTFHPGRVRTNLTNKLGFPLKYIAALATPFFISAAKGAQTGIWLASSADVTKVTGKYFIKMLQVQPAATVLSVDDAVRLRKLSEQLCDLPEPVSEA